MLGLFAVSASFPSDNCQLNTAVSLEIRLTIIVKSDGPKNWGMSIQNEYTSGEIDVNAWSCSISRGCRSQPQC